MTDPQLERHPVDGETRGVALFCHGGTAASQAPPKDRALSLVRMRAFERFVRETDHTKPGAEMPAFPDLSETDAAAIAAWLGDLL